MSFALHSFIILQALTATGAASLKNMTQMPRLIHDVMYGEEAGTRRHITLNAPVLAAKPASTP